LLVRRINAPKERCAILRLKAPGNGNVELSIVCPGQC
jgi:hypothetical protein